MKRIYLRRILGGKMTFDEVPWLWEEEVRELLKEEGREDLINAK